MRILQYLLNLLQFSTMSVDNEQYITQLGQIVSILKDSEQQIPFYMRGKRLDPSTVRSLSPTVGFVYQATVYMHARGVKLDSPRGREEVIKVINGKIDREMIVSLPK